MFIQKDNKIVNLNLVSYIDIDQKDLIVKFNFATSPPTFTKFICKNQTELDTVYRKFSANTAKI